MQQLLSHHTLSVPCKVFAHVLLARLQPLFHRTCCPQSGFTKSQLTLDAILALRLLSELHSKFQKPLHAAFVDLKLAFDSVDRAALWLALKGKGFHLHLPSSCPLAHKALIRWCQLLLFYACIWAWLRDVHPCCSLSFSTVLLHVVLGLPTLCVPSGVHVRAVAQWLLWSILSTCPIQLYLLCRTTSLHLCVCPLFSNSSLEITYGQ